MQPPICLLYAPSLPRIFRCTVGTISSSQVHRISEYVFRSTARGGPACLSNAHSRPIISAGPVNMMKGLLFSAAGVEAASTTPPGLTVIKKQHWRSYRNRLRLPGWLFLRIQSVCVNYAEPVLVLTPSMTLLCANVQCSCVQRSGCCWSVSIVP